jgi:hypothetical protein
MKRIRIVGLCLVAAFALSAMVATSALGAKHANTGPVKFEATTGLAFLEIESVGNTECQKSITSGQIINATQATVTSKFFECETLSKKCHSAGQAEGVIVTNPLITNLGYINKVKNEVGQEFVPAGSPTEPLAEYKCEGTPAVASRAVGATIGRLVTAKTGVSGPAPTAMSTESESIIKSTKAKGPQEIQDFEGDIEPDVITAELSTEGGPFVKHNGVQNSTGEVKNLPQIVVKGKKVTPYPDLNQVKLGGPTPEYGRCRAKTKGKFSDENCHNAVSGKTKGKFEFYPVPS